jgi:hypothetical protein
MSNISNLNTIRKNYIDSSSFQTLENKIFLKNFIFLESLKEALEIKNVDTADIVCYANNNLINISMSVFFKAKKCNKLHLQVFNKKKKKVIFKNLFEKYFSFNKNNITLFKIITLNRFINSSIVIFLYGKLKKFLSLLFVRRFSLFIDFLKINSLLLLNKISCSFYLHYLGSIFKFLLKRKHTLFIMFLKYLFKVLFSLKQTTDLIKGFKFVLSGRFQAKMRASSIKLIEGSVPLQSIGLNIKYSKLHVYTMYGVFGFKLWINN